MAKSHEQESRLIGTRAEIRSKAFKAVRWEYPYASFEMQSALAGYIEQKIHDMDLDIKAMYKEWSGGK
jgi:hypothetical protein